MPPVDYNATYRLQCHLYITMPPIDYNATYRLRLTNTQLDVNAVGYYLNENILIKLLSGVIREIGLLIGPLSSQVAVLFGMFALFVFDRFVCLFALLVCFFSLKPLFLFLFCFCFFVFWLVCYFKAKKL